jgi:hypothetical protein
MMVCPAALIAAKHSKHKCNSTSDSVHWEHTSKPTFSSPTVAEAMNFCGHPTSICTVSECPSHFHQSKTKAKELSRPRAPIYATSRRPINTHCPVSSRWAPEAYETVRQWGHVRATPATVDQDVAGMTGCILSKHDDKGDGRGGWRTIQTPTHGTQSAYGVASSISLETKQAESVATECLIPELLLCSNIPLLGMHPACPGMIGQYSSLVLLPILDERLISQYPQVLQDGSGGPWVDLAGHVWQAMSIARVLASLTESNPA